MNALVPHSGCPSNSRSSSDAPGWPAAATQPFPCWPPFPRQESLFRAHKGKKRLFTFSNVSDVKLTLNSGSLEMDPRFTPSPQHTGYFKGCLSYDYFWCSFLCSWIYEDLDARTDPTAQCAARSSDISVENDQSNQERSQKVGKPPKKR